MDFKNLCQSEWSVAFSCAVCFVCTTCHYIWAFLLSLSSSNIGAIGWKYMKYLHTALLCVLPLSLQLSLSHTHRIAHRGVGSMFWWQCLCWASAGYWHQVSGDLRGSRLAGISLDCIKGELHDTGATRVLYLLAPAFPLHAHTHIETHLQAPYGSHSLKCHSANAVQIAAIKWSGLEE